MEGTKPEGGDRALSNVVIRCSDTILDQSTEIQQFWNVHSSNSLDATGRYLLSPPPSLEDPIFDDLLEGKATSSGGSSSGKERADESSSVDASPGECIRRNTEYLKELLRDERNLADIPPLAHLRALLTREIVRVQKQLRLLRRETSNEETPHSAGNSSVYFCGQFDFDGLDKMPPAAGPIECVTDTVHIPTDQYPRYNFVGRLFGPRGLTIKKIEQESGCEITVRGRGESGYDPNEQLHVCICCTDHTQRALFKVRRAKRLIERLVVPIEHDELKESQLHELAIIRQYWRRRRAYSAEAVQQIPDVLSLMPQPAPAPSSDQGQHVPPAIVGPPCDSFYFFPTVTDTECNGLIPMLWPHHASY